MAKKVAKTDVTVFIHGPTGTGKEVISNFIHQNSERSENPFVAINCMRHVHYESHWIIMIFAC